ncbi:MAG: DUF1772 domain-containing protein [Methyloglobulus sp.]|nr:DUF1772 domain-containing protein [Methyloglobulus sp.]
MELIFKVFVLVLASFYTGIVVFLSTVLRKAFDTLSEKDYLNIYSKIILFGRSSFFINGLILIPLAIIVAYVALGFRNSLFIAGETLYITASFAVSRYMNEPIYNLLLKTDGDERIAINEIRVSINKANIVRAIISSAGIILLAISFFIEW